MQFVMVISPYMNILRPVLYTCTLTQCSKIVILILTSILYASVLTSILYAVIYLVTFVY